MRVWWMAAVLLASTVAGCAGTDPESEPGPQATDDTPAPLATGYLRGVVFDEAIRPVNSAEIVISTAGDEAAILTTDADGAWGVGELAPGTYDIRVSKPGYEATNVTGEVVAGEQTPALIEVMLISVPVDASFVWPVVWDGVVACGATPQNWCAGVNLATGVDVFNDQSFKFLFDDFIAYGRTPDYLQVEFVWEPNVEVSGQAFAAFWASTWDEWDACLCSPNIFASEGGSSYILVQADRAVLEELDVGLSRGVGVAFSVGTGSEENLQDPSTYSVMVNQPFQGFFHVFYGCLPPDGWLFTVDGDPGCDPNSLEGA